MLNIYEIIGENPQYETAILCINGGTSIPITIDCITFMETRVTENNNVDVYTIIVEKDGKKITKYYINNKDVGYIYFE